jgi:hypothetical protein
MPDNDTCPSCGKWTTEGQERWRKSLKPISGIDLSQPLSKLIEDVWSQLVRSRGELSDIGFRFSGWTEQLKQVEGLLTCGLISLHHVMEQMREHEAKYPKPAEPAPAE